MNTSIRKATIDDFESVYSLINDLEGHLMNRLTFQEIYSKNISDPNIYNLVAIKESKVVGFISLHIQHILHHSRATCELQELNIDPEFRGSGIGAQLMNEAERIAKELNLEEIELTTKIHRDQAQAFYKKLGYTHTHNKYVKKL